MPSLTGQDANCAGLNRVPSGWKFSERRCQRHSASARPRAAGRTRWLPRNPVTSTETHGSSGWPGWEGGWPPRRAPPTVRTWPG